jgi:Bacterial EndoU nuclease
MRSGGHYYDSGMPNKTVFPKAWTPDRIISTIEDIANNPDQRPVQQNDGRWAVVGTRDGVTVKVIVDGDGTVVTGYPTSGAGVCVNDENGDPQPLPADTQSVEASQQEALGESEAQAGANAQAQVQEQEQVAAAQAEAQAAEAEGMAQAQALIEAETLAMEEAE